MSGLRSRFTIVRTGADITRKAEGSQSLVADGVLYLVFSGRAHRHLASGKEQHQKARYGIVSRLLIPLVYLYVLRARVGVMASYVQTNTQN